MLLSPLTVLLSLAWLPPLPSLPPPGDAVAAANSTFHVRTYSLPGRPSGLVVAPLDGDALPDLALVTSSSSTGVHELATWRGLGDATFAPAWATDLPPSDVGHTIRAFDVNVDGVVDLSLPGMVGVGALRFGDGSLVYDDTTHVPNAGGTVFDITYADYSGDGLPDAMTALVDIGGYFMDTALNAGDGSFGAQGSSQMPGVGGFHVHLLCEELDGDGVANDVVLASTAGLSTFRYGPYMPTVEHVSGWFGEVATGDLDADGDLDLVATMPARDETHVLANDGAGHFVPSQDFVTGGAPSHLVLADFDGDGHLDVAVTHEVSGTVRLLRNDGRGGLHPQRPIRVEVGLGDLEAADLDLDDDVDLVVISRAAETLSILRNSLHP